MDPRPQPEGSYETGSVHPSFRLSISFLGIDSLVWHGVRGPYRGPYTIVCDRAGFFRKNPHWAEMTKNVPKTWLFDFLRKSSL